jgi:hypothetical protein
MDWLITEGSKVVSSLDDSRAKLNERWPNEWPTTKGQLAGFIDKCPTDAYTVNPEPDNPQSSYCFPTPRSWEMAIRAQTTCRCLGVKEELSNLFIEACVGKGAAVAYITYLSKLDLPDIMTVLEKGWKVDTDRLDRTMAVATGLTARVLETPEPKEQGRLAALGWKRLDDMIEAGLTDIAYRHTEAFVTRGFGRKSKFPAVAQAATDTLYKISQGPMGAYIK